MLCFMHFVSLGRSHTCGQLGASDVGSRVVLCGWVSFKRLFFLLLRDSYGVTQVQPNYEVGQNLLFELVSTFRSTGTKSYAFILCKIFIFHKTF